MIGCGKAEEPAINQSTPIPASTTPLPLETVPLGARPSSPSIGWSTAAAKLGAAEQQLRNALGNPGQGPPDFAAAAKQLNVSEEALREALGFPQWTPPSSGSPPPSTTTTVNSI